MGRLLQLFMRNGGFVAIVLVEAFCFFLIVQFNTKQNAIFAHTAGVFGGTLLEKRQQTLDYLSYKERADSLALENERLQTKVANMQAMQLPYRDTFFTVLYDTLNRVDSVRRRATRPLYAFIAARVIGNNISSVNNWIVLNRGSHDNVKPNMAVVSREGIVGIVRHVNPDFSMAMSVLHRQSRISASLRLRGQQSARKGKTERQEAAGSLIWEGGDPELLTLKFIPRHFNVTIGDTIVTSGYSQMFPAGVVVGFVADNAQQDPENPYFWTLKVRPSQDMASVRDVYIVNNIFSEQIDSTKNLVKKDEQ